MQKHRWRLFRRWFTPPVKVQPLIRLQTAYLCFACSTLAEGTLIGKCHRCGSDNVQPLARYFQAQKQRMDWLVRGNTVLRAELERKHAPRDNPTAPLNEALVLTSLKEPIFRKKESAS